MVLTKTLSVIVFGQFSEQINQNEQTSITQTIKTIYADPKQTKDGQMDATQWMMRHSPCMRCIISESEAASSLNQTGWGSMHRMEVITLSSATSGLIWD